MAARNDCKECDGTGLVAGSQAHFKCPECTPTGPPDETLIRQCMDALECAGAYTALIDDYSLAAIQDAFRACQIRLGVQHGTDN